MEFIMIDMDILKRILTEINDLTETVTKLRQNHEDKGLKKWLNNGDVCQILNMSKRTLLKHRDAGKVPFSKISGTYYYKPEDIERLLIKSKEEGTWK